MHLETKKMVFSHSDIMCNFMRQLLTILIGLFWTVSSYSDCRGERLNVFPAGQTTKQNSILVLDGTFGQEKELNLLNQ